MGMETKGPECHTENPDLEVAYIDFGRKDTLSNTSEAGTLTFMKYSQVPGPWISILHTFVCLILTASLQSEYVFIFSFGEEIEA